MAEFKGAYEAKVTFAMTITEEEASALNLMSAYDVPKLVEHIGKLVPFDDAKAAGLRDFLKACTDLHGALSRTREARQVMSGRIIAVPRPKET